MTVKPQKTYWISIRPRSVGTELHAAIRDLREMAAVGSPPKKVHLYAGGLSFATPSEVCGLRAVLEVASRVAARVTFECPSSLGVHRYLQRMNFYADLPSNITLTRPVLPASHRDRGDSLIELTSISSEAQTSQLVRRVMRVAQRDFGSAAILQAFCVAVSETLENAAEHANSEIGALISAQRYETSRLELMVVDIGQGVRRSLAKNPRYADLGDMEALRRSLDDGVSAVEQEGRGGGLPDLINRARSVAWSQVVIRSGKAEVSIEQYGDLVAIQPQSLSVEVTGTWIYVRLESFRDDNERG